MDSESIMVMLGDGGDDVRREDIIGGQPLCEPSRTVRTGPNLNSTQNGDPKDLYLQREGRNEHDEVMRIPKRFCKSLLKSRDMTVCIWHKSVCTLPKRFGQGSNRP